MSAYVFDTNTVSLFVRSRASTNAVQRLRSLSIESATISIVTRAEILFGLAKAGHPPRLSYSVEVFFRTVTVLPWAESEAHTYAELRRTCESQGITIAPLDLMIAAQALSAGAILVTNDTALKRLTPWLPVEDWTG
ncbi:hypothetical protein ABAC460_21075 [Asticcacaulis sp. AC460]|uniref:type II toxin-antitoxin system VapC family toxin n=1 Tax=Asticcacaulis sp. AC460 TaxID=1282360 RepID=UPI0003C3E0BF|nr:type II toxin-antitoxin system VapC family toxin [Asticcacaulis sp. AC460]ESQ87064.1 hypothetical protein ABAC460_21075 [Asticcacaulis sp. AC460]